VSAATPTAPGIAQRPAIDPEVLAVLAAAVDQAWPRPRVVLAAEPSRPPAWRFSGRWWSRPATTRRDRPLAGG
jgi:hypothetical protein